MTIENIRLQSEVLKEMEASIDLLTTNYKDADKKEIEWEVMLLVETPLAGNRNLIWIYGMYITYRFCWM